VSAPTGIRPDIAELLAAGHSDRFIARLVQVHTTRVAAARRTLGIPSHPLSPTRAGSVEDLYWRRVIHTLDGHLLWPGTQLRIRAGRDGGRISVGQLAFRIKHHRDPVGKVTAGCGTTGCIHPEHVEDQPMRERYDAIFGEGAA
jgi:hypothetical protein